NQQSAGRCSTFLQKMLQELHAMGSATPRSYYSGQRRFRRVSLRSRKQAKRTSRKIVLVSMAGCVLVRRATAPKASHIARCCENGECRFDSKQGGVVLALEAH